MFTITITEDSLSNIINAYCSCGGRGPNDNPCTACSIYYAIIRFNSNSQQANRVDRALSCPYCHAVDRGGENCHQCGQALEPVRQLT